LPNEKTVTPPAEEAPEAPDRPASSVSIEPALPPTEEHFRQRRSIDAALESDPFAFPAPGRDSEADSALSREEREARDAAIGPRVSPDEHHKADYIDPIEAFLTPKATEKPTKEVPLDRLGTVLKLRALSTPHYTRLVEQYTVVRRDRETGERVEQTKDRELRAQLIIDSTQNLDFNDERLYKHFKLRHRDPHALVEEMFLPGEVAQLSEWVMRVSGGERLFLEEEAKGF
jgi:hypothetical protein